MSEQNVEWVKGVYDAFSRGDIPAVLGAFADDVEWFEAEGMPYGGLYRSGEAVLQNVLPSRISQTSTRSSSQRSSPRPELQTAH